MRQDFKAAWQIAHIYAITDGMKRELCQKIEATRAEARTAGIEAAAEEIDALKSDNERLRREQAQLDAAIYIYSFGDKSQFKDLPTVVAACERHRTATQMERKNGA